MCAPHYLVIFLLAYLFTLRPGLNSNSLFSACLVWVSEVAQSCPTLCDTMDCSLPGFSVHGIFQAIVPEWIAISFSRGSSQPRDWTRVSWIVDRCFTTWATREVWWYSIPHWCTCSVSVVKQMDYLLWVGNSFLEHHVACLFREVTIL